MHNLVSIFLRLSLLVNIIVLIPVCISLTASGTSKTIVSNWGTRSPSRDILLSIYISILFVSCALFVLSLYNQISESTKNMVFVVLFVQVLYKMITPLILGIYNPVVISNIFIASLHIVTLVLMWQSMVM